MTLDVELLVDDGMGGENSWGRAWCLEALHFSFSPSCGAVRVLGAVVWSAAHLVFSRKADIPQGGARGLQSIGHDGVWRETLPLEPFPREFQDLAFTVYRTV